ncbi:MAG: hexose kinase [Gammaproteobacteria bacterium]
MNDQQNHVSVLALNPSVDISYEISQLLEYQKVRAKKTFYHPGGNGINIARALTELAVPVNCCSTVAGESGDLLLKLLGDTLGDRHKWFRVQGETRLNTTVLTHNPPGQYEITSIGPEIPPEVLQKLFDSLLETAGNGITVLSGQLPPGVPDSTYQTLIERINQQGGKAVLDSHSEVLQLGMEAKPWLVRFNRHILEMSVQRRMDTVQDVAEAARMIQQQRGIEYVCASLGDQGAVLVDSDNAYHCEAPKVHKLSTVGCGDSLVSGLVAAALNGESTAPMLRFGVVCGSATASHPGTELFSREELDSPTMDVEVTKLDS